MNSGTASYHLRQLGAAGFVEEDTERGNARERWWRSVHRTTWFNDPELAEREPEAALAYQQSVASIYALRTQQTLNDLQTMPRVWRERFDLSDWVLRLTPRKRPRSTRSCGASSAATGGTPRRTRRPPRRARNASASSPTSCPS